MKKFLFFGVILVLFLLPFSVSADHFSIDAFSDYTLSTISTSPPANYITLRNLSAGTIIEFSRSYPWPSHNVGSSVSDISDSDFFRFKINSNLSILNFYFASSATISFRFYSSIVSSDDFSEGDPHPIVPISPSGTPGGYSIHLTTEYVRNELFFYSGHLISDFGDLTPFFDSSYTESYGYVAYADELYFDNSFVLTPEKYAINLTPNVHVYKFVDVPVGDYSFNDVFVFNKSFDISSYRIEDLIIPKFVVIDNTSGYGQQAYGDIFSRYEDGEITGQDAIDQMQVITNIMIDTSEDPSEKLYWVIYQKSFVDRIQSEESDRRRRADVESALSGFEEALESKDQSSGNRFVDQLSGAFGNVLPTASYTSLLSPLVSAISYSGVGGGFTFPAITIPKLSFTDQEYTLNDEMYVDFGEYIDLFPEPLLIVVRCLIVIGLYLWAFFEMKDLIFQVFVGGDIG